MSLTNQSQPCSPYIKSPLLWHFLSNSCFSVQDFHTLTSLFFSQMFTIVCIPSPPETKFHNDRTHVCSVPRYLHSVWNHIRLLACAPWICNETRNDSFVLDLSRILRYVAWASLTPAGAKARVLIYIRQEVRWSRTGKHASSGSPWWNSQGDSLDTCHLSSHSHISRMVPWRMLPQWELLFNWIFP